MNKATTAACLIFACASTKGESIEARFVEAGLSESCEGLRDLNAFGHTSAQAKLFDVFQDCKKADWDGYGAMGVSDLTYYIARSFLQALPFWVAEPTFGAEPDGHLTFEWHRGPRKTLSVSVNPEKKLHYAALFGSESYSGTTPFYDEVPHLILEVIKMLNAQ